MTGGPPERGRPVAHNALRSVWTEERIRALGAVTDLPTAASIFGLSRTAAYDLVKQDDFPVPVIRVGARYRIPVAAILAVLHLACDPPPPAPPATDLNYPRTRGSITDMQSERHQPLHPYLTPDRGAQP